MTTSILIFSIIYIIFFVAFCIIFYILFDLNNKIKHNNDTHRKAIIDAGAALTDALKIAFDHIKQINTRCENMRQQIGENRDKIHTIMSYQRKSEKKSKNPLLHLNDNFEKQHKEKQT